MDYNGLSIVSPQYYPDDEEWNDFFSLWYQDYNLNTDITEHFHYLISHSDYLVMVQRPLNNDNSDYEIIPKPLDVNCKGDASFLLKDVYSADLFHVRLRYIYSSAKASA